MSDSSQPSDSSSKSPAPPTKSLEPSKLWQIDGKYYDQLIPIPGPEGMAWSRKLAQQEGIFTGVSGGSTFAVPGASLPMGSMAGCGVSRLSIIR